MRRRDIALWITCGVMCFALAAGALWLVYLLATMDLHTDRPRGCDGLTAYECTAWAQAETDELMGGW